MDQPHELDLEARRGRYGCSMLGAFLGVDPRRDLHSAYLELVEGMVRPPEPWMLNGKDFEEPIARVASRQTGIKFIPMFNQTLTHPEFPKYHLCGTPDAMAEDAEHEGGLECKLSSWHQRHQFGPTSDDIPPHYELQVRGYMAITRLPRWRLAIWQNDRALIYVFERDVEFEGFFLEQAEENWRKYIEARVPPPIGASRISAEWLQRKYPEHKSPDLRTATEDEIAMLRHYGNVRATQKALEKERLLLENQLKNAIKDREGLEWPGGRFTWRKASDSKTVDWQSMAIALRTFYIHDEDARERITEDYTHYKPGTRRIWLKSDEYSETPTRESANAAA